MTSAVCFSSLAGILSGPVAFVVSSDFSTACTSAPQSTNSVIMGSSGSEVWSFTSLLVNTVAKYLLNRFAIPSGLSAETLGVRGEVTESLASLVAVEIRSGTLFDFDVSL